MSIVERFNQLDLPADRCVVIGSGVLDALGLRSAVDIDLAVEQGLFNELRQSGDWQIGEKQDGVVLTREDAEVWTGWGRDDGQSFEDLFKNGITVNGVRFAHPQTVLEWKRAKGRPKDLRDIELLEEYLRNV